MEPSAQLGVLRRRLSNNENLRQVSDGLCWRFKEMEQSAQQGGLSWRGTDKRKAAQQILAVLKGFKIALEVRNIGTLVAQQEWLALDVKRFRNLQLRSVGGAGDLYIKLNCQLNRVESFTPGNIVENYWWIRLTHPTARQRIQSR